MKQPKDDDNMPGRFSPEFEEYEDRLMLLSNAELCDLLDLVGIKFFVPREELEQDPKEELVAYLDEADSRQKVEDYLRSKGL